MYKGESVQCKSGCLSCILMSYVAAALLQLVLAVDSTNIHCSMALHAEGKIR